MGLIKVKADYEEAKEWITERMGKDQKVRKPTKKEKREVLCQQIMEVNVFLSLSKENSIQIELSPDQFVA